MAQALGMQALAADMGWSLKPRVHSDATAAIGISKRRGLGKIRHLHTCDLGVQEQTRTERVLLEKILGTENPADIFTKYLDHATMAKALKTMNCEFRDGRAKAAPDTMGLKRKDNVPTVDLRWRKRTNREDDRHSGHCESKPRTSESKAALAVVTHSR